MKTFLFVLASILVLQNVSARALDDAPQTCEDFLKPEVCTKLRDTAKIFKEKANIVNEAIQAAAAKHLSNAKEISEFVKNYLVERAVNFNCEDSLSADLCNKLRDIAKTFKEQASIVNEAIRAAAAKHLSNAQEITKFVKEYLVERATNFDCADVLSADQCQKLDDFAAKFQVSVKNMTMDLKEAIADGIVQGKDLYVKTKEILLEKLNNFKCEQLMDAATCQKITDYATLIKATPKEVKAALIEAYAKGIERSQDFLEEAKRYLKEEVSCDGILGKDACDIIRSFIKNTRVSLDEVIQKLREAVANGTKGTFALAKVAWAYIKDNVWPFGFSDLPEEKVVELLDMLEKYDL